MRSPFGFKSSLVPLSQAFSSHSHFCVNDYIVKLYTKIAGNISSGRYGASNTAGFYFFHIFFTYKVPLITSFESRKSFARMPSMAYTEVNQIRRCVTSMFTFVCIFDIFTHIDK